MRRMLFVAFASVGMGAVYAAVTTIIRKLAPCLDLTERTATTRVEHTTWPVNDAIQPYLCG